MRQIKGRNAGIGMTKFVTLALSLLWAGAAVAQNAQAALQEAAREAAVLCYRVDPENSLEECGDMAGRSPKHSAARKAIGRMYTARTTFIDQCKPMRGMSCIEFSELQIGVGRWAAWKELGLVR
jgi:hypothetical protein